MTKPVATAALIATLALTGCSGKKRTPAQQFRQQIEQAHNIEVWRSHEALAMDADISFSGMDDLSATFIFETTGGRARMELVDGTVVIHDGHTAWANRFPEDIPGPLLRFHVLTWPWFAASPFYMGGSDLAEPFALPLREGGETYPVVKQTFPPAAGDAPDDWYILYRDPDTDRLAAESYIVTYFKPKAEAEKEPHAIIYDQYVAVDGVWLSMDWTFYNWNNEQGCHGDPIGTVTISRYAFRRASDDLFEPGKNWTRLPLPGAAQ